jgi:hypothetical protein
VFNQPPPLIDYDVTDDPDFTAIVGRVPPQAV